MSILAGRAISEASIEAVVIRKDGTGEELGVIAFHSKSLWKRLKYKFGRIAKKLKRSVV